MDSARRPLLFYRIAVIRALALVRTWLAGVAAPAPGGSEPGAGALGDQVALELRDGAQHVEQ